MGGMAPKLRRVSILEIKSRWAHLSLDKRKDVLCFEEPVLVDRIKASLQALYNKQEWMRSLGIQLSGVADDPFAASSLFTQAFEFTWQIARSARNPNVVLVAPSGRPVMAVKDSFLEGEKLFVEFGRVLDDFLSERCGRVPLAKPRWKEIWTSEPSSVAAVELQLA